MTHRCRINMMTSWYLNFVTLRYRFIGAESQLKYFNFVNRPLSENPLNQIIPEDVNLTDSSVRKIESIQRYFFYKIWTLLIQPSSRTDIIWFTMYKSFYMMFFISNIPSGFKISNILTLCSIYYVNIDISAVCTLYWNNLLEE